mgnify:FL=1
MRRIYEEDRRAADFAQRLAAYNAEKSRQLREGIFGKPGAPPLPELFPEGGNPTPDSPASAPAPNAQSAMPNRQSPDSPSLPSCPQCGRPMVRRTAGDGSPFWGGSAYPQCKGRGRM